MNPSQSVHRVWALFLAGILTGCGADRGNTREFLSLGTAGTGGIYYPIGGALASRLSVADSLRQYTAEVTGGSVENVNRLREGQIDLAFALGVSIYEAHRGGDRGAEPFEELRIVAPLYANVLHVLVPRGSTASTLDDLAGARVSVGAAGSGTEQVARQILEVHGLSYETVDARFLTFSESAASLRDGAIDAAIISVGYPAAAVLEATTTGGARLLGLDRERIEALTQRYPYYSAGQIPPGAYPGVEEEIPTVAMMNWVASRADLAGEVVESLLNILRDDRASLERVHEMATQIDLAMLADAPIPLHPAAARWLER
ncbi:TAXI family TRAP transporter solute-binding subunit [Gemmatimonadota bacterium]